MNNTPMLFSLVSAVILGPASAATTLIDFGTADAPSPYNQILITTGGATASSSIIAHNDTTSAATGWSAQVLETETGNGGNAGGGANLSTFPAGFNAAALRDSIFANQAAEAAPSMVLTLSVPITNPHS